MVVVKLVGAFGVGGAVSRSLLHVVLGGVPVGGGDVGVPVRV